MNVGHDRLEPAMTHRGYLAGGAAALSGVLMAACAVGPAGEQGPAPAGREVTILMDNDWESPPARLAVVQAWLARASQVHPRIKYELRSAGGNAGAIAHFASGTEGDITHSGFQLLLTLGPKGVYQDISPALASLKFDEKSVFDIYDDTHLADKKRVGLMIQINSNVWVYNKSWFQQTGTAEPTDKWTWQNHLDTARKLTKVDEVKWGMNANVDIYPWFWQAGVDILTPDGTKTLFNSAASREVLNWVIDIIAKFRASPNPAEIAEKRPSFPLGNYATAIASSPGSAFNTQIGGKFQ